MKLKEMTVILMINLMIDIFHRIFGIHSPSRIIGCRPKKWEVRQMEKDNNRNNETRGARK